MCSHLLYAYTCVYTQITKAYVTSRLESVETVLRESLENPLDDKTMVSQQLDQLATIGRYVRLVRVYVVPGATRPPAVISLSLSLSQQL